MNISLLSLHLMRLSIQELDTKRLDIYKPANSIEKNTEMMGEYTSVAPAIGAPQPASRIDNQRSISNHQLPRSSTGFLLRLTDFIF